jgi:hypothetical protein
VIRLANPPWCWPPDRIGRLTDRQLVGLFTGFKRGEGLVPVLDDPGGRAAVTPATVYREYLTRCGVTDPGEQAREWAAELARRKARAEKAKKHATPKRRRQ